jgi:hypothetical protein
MSLRCTAVSDSVAECYRFREIKLMSDSVCRIKESVVAPTDNFFPFSLQVPDCTVPQQSMPSGSPIIPPRTQEVDSQEPTHFTFDGAVFPYNCSLSTKDDSLSEWRRCARLSASTADLGWSCCSKAPHTRPDEPWWRSSQQDRRTELGLSRPAQAPGIGLLALP